MKKFIPIIVLLQLALIILLVFIFAKKKHSLKTSEINDYYDDEWDYVEPRYKNYFKKKWKNDAKKIGKEIKDSNRAFI